MEGGECPKRQCGHETKCGFDRIEANAYFASFSGGIYVAQTKGRITLNEIGAETDDDQTLSTLRDLLQTENVRE